eukprot:GHVT01075230.1.p1 GENE.GHVT01075230.1~~GHVT01075230.1.p1  ORF type:complete len:105 (-),score=3.48 GHVT01075230.1:860-1174(-)
MEHVKNMRLMHKRFSRLMVKELNVETDESKEPETPLEASLRVNFEDISGPGWKKHAKFVGDQQIEFYKVSNVFVAIKHAEFMLCHARDTQFSAAIVNNWKLEAE